MSKIYSSQDVLLLGHLKNVLEQAGIESMFNREYLRAAAGEVPPTECWTELWILDDSRTEEANALVQQALSTPAAANEAWTCAKCGESLEAQFTECWSCGTSKATREPT